MVTNYPESLGKVMGNLHSLEFGIRAFLCNLRSHGSSAKISPDYYALKVGDIVDEDELSNWDTLGQLVDKFNDYVSGRDASLAIDTRIIVVRDLLAHGRVFSKTADVQTLRIVKFDYPQGGRVRVVASALLDEAWFKEQTNLTHAQILKVQAAAQQYT